MEVLPRYDFIINFEKIDLILSEEILKEFEDVMMRKEVRNRFDYTQNDVKNFVKALKDIAITVRVKSDFKVIKEDPKDDVVINTGYDGRVDYIVSGDKHLKNLKEFKGIQIVRPKEMIDVLIKNFSEFVIPIERVETIAGMIIIKKKTL